MIDIDVHKLEQKVKTKGLDLRLLDLIDDLDDQSAGIVTQPDYDFDKAHVSNEGITLYFQNIKDSTFSTIMLYLDGSVDAKDSEGNDISPDVLTDVEEKETNIANIKIEFPYGYNPEDYEIADYKARMDSNGLTLRAEVLFTRKDSEA